MICPECCGNGFIKIPGDPDPWETSHTPFSKEIELNCPTCEGQGKIPDTPPEKHCPACGEPLDADQIWCEQHQGAALISDL
jgi:DnaJ-class molecular chaperone